MPVKHVPLPDFSSQIILISTARRVAVPITLCLSGWRSTRRLQWISPARSAPTHPHKTEHNQCIQLNHDLTDSINKYIFKTQGVQVHFHDVFCSSPYPLFCEINYCLYWSFYVCRSSRWSTTQMRREPMDQWSWGNVVQPSQRKTPASSSSRQITSSSNTTAAERRWSHRCDRILIQILSMLCFILCIY